MAGTNKKVLIEVKVITSGAEKNLNNLTKETDKVAEKGKKANKSFLGLGKTLLAIGRGFVIVKSFQLLARTISETIRVSSQFELVMKKVQAISGATEKQFVKLEKSAKELALGTMFTATEVGELQLAYSKLGFSTEEILNATEATLNLATATGEDLANAADVVGSTIRGFNLEAEEASRVADVMAQSFSSSALNLEAFKQSMKTVAPIASAANVDLETTTALLGKLADSGLRGTRAATGLKNLMSQLTNPTSKLAQELGYTVGNSEGLIHAFRELSEKNIDLADATQLTDERSKAAFITLLNGVDSVEQLRGSLENANGAAAAMADIIQDSVVGSFKALESEWEDTMIAMGSSTEGLQKFFANQLTIMLKIFKGNLQEAKEFAADIAATEAVSPVIRQLQEQSSELDKSNKLALDRLKRRHQTELNLAKEQGLDLKELRKIQEEETANLLDSQAQKELSLRKRHGKALGDQIVVLQEEQKKLIEEHSAFNFENARKEVKRLSEIEESERTALQNKTLKYYQERLQNEDVFRSEIISKLEKENKEYMTLQLQIDKYRKVGEGLVTVQQQINEDTEKTSAILKSLNGDVDNVYKSFRDWVGELDKINSHSGFNFFTKELNESIDAALEFNDANEEVLEKLPEVNLGIQTISLSLGDYAQALFETGEEVRAFQDAMGSMFELFDVIQMNKLMKLEQQHDAEYEMMAEAQDKQLEKRRINDKHAIDSFVGTQEAKADYEKFIALQTLAFEEKQQEKRDAAREKQLEKENALAKKAFKARQNNAMADIAINTAIAIAKAPAEGLILGAPALIALISASAIAQMAAVQSQKFQPKTFQDGGTIVGDSHSDGGVPFTVAGQAGFEAEGGEYIFSRKTVDRLGTGLLDAINFGGARPMMFADGGAVSRGAIETAASQPTMSEMLMEAVEAFGSIPVVNVAQDTVDTSRLVENAASMARL